MAGELVSTITNLTGNENMAWLYIRPHHCINFNLSMPMPRPAVGGMPDSKACRKSSSTPQASSSPSAFFSAYKTIPTLNKIIQDH